VYCTNTPFYEFIKGNSQFVSLFMILYSNIHTHICERECFTHSHNRIINEGKNIFGRKQAFFGKEQHTKSLALLIHNECRSIVVLRFPPGERVTYGQKVSSSITIEINDSVYEKLRLQKLSELY
jgi:hypothetical protein